MMLQVKPGKYPDTFNQINTSLIPQFFVVAFEGNLQSPPIPRANFTQQVSPLLHVQLEQILQQSSSINGLTLRSHLGSVVCWTLSVEKLSIDQEQTDPGSCHELDVFLSGDGHDWSVETVTASPLEHLSLTTVRTTLTTLITTVN